MAARSLGKLEVEIGGNTSGLDVAETRTIASVGRMSSAAVKASSIITTALAFGGAALAVRSLVNGIDAAAKSMDSMAKSAQSLGMSSEYLSSLSYAARGAGVSSEALSGSVKELSRRLSNVDPMSEATRAMQALGLAYEGSTTKGMKVESTLMAVADKFAGMKDGINKTNLAISIFGEQGIAMIPMLNKGSAGIKKMMEESNSLGLTLDENGKKLSSDYSEKLSSVGAIASGVGNQITTALLPHINASMDSFTNWAKANDIARRAGEITKDIISKIGSAFDMMSGPIRIATAVMANFWDTMKLAVSGEFKKAIEQYSKTMQVYDTAVANSTLRTKTFADESVENWKAIGEASAKIAAEQQKRDAPAVVSAYELNKALEERQKLYASSLQDASSDNGTTATDKIARMTEMVKAGAISWREYVAAVRAINEGETQQALSVLMDDKQMPINEKIKELNRLLADGSINMNTFANTMKSVNDAGRQNMNDLASTTSQALTSIFSDNKAAAIAAAIINTYQGVTNAIANYPPPVSFAMAGLQAAMGFAQVAKIRSTNKGSSGGSASSAVSSAAPAAAATNGQGAAQGGNQTLFVQGIDPKGLFSGEVVRDLAKKFIDFQRDGGNIILGRT